MEALSVPNSTVRVSRLGFGCARIFGGRETRAGARLIEAALRHGITHFDTAPSYGSEAVLGTVLAGMTDVTIATKVGVARFAGEQSAAKRIVGPLYRATLRPLLGHMPALKSRLLRRRLPGNAVSQTLKMPLPRDTVMRDLEESLRDLRRTAIDVYLIHEPDDVALTDELLELFQSLHSSGVIKAFGLAFGGVPSPTPFGQIVQGRYAAGAAPVRPGEEVRIHHGVVRFGMQAHGDIAERRDPSMMIQHALASDPHSTVIFSASTQRQISQISGAAR